jgi:chaperonin GroEL
VEGFEADCGLASPYFCEDPARLQTVFEDARILITDQKLSHVKDILPILESALRDKFALVIIADDFSPEALSALVVNRARAGLRVAALKINGIADRRASVLGDIAALTGAAIISHSADLSLSDASEGHLGTCKKVIMNMEDTKFIADGGAGVAERIASIKAQIEAEGDEYNRARLGERLARLSGGVAILSVGAATEIEQKEKRLRIDDAVAATRAACEQGIVAGGGLALLRVQKVLRVHVKTLPEPLRAGAGIVCEALSAPISQICANSGKNPGVIIDKISRTRKNKNRGFDARSGRFVDMISAGIIDPAKVTKNALLNAASVAATLITTEGIILQSSGHAL